MNPSTRTITTSKWVLPGVAVILAATTVFGWMVLSSERTRSEELAARNAVLTGSLERLRVQMDSVNTRLTSLDETVRNLRTAAAESPAPAPVEQTAAPTRVRRVAPAVTKPAPPVRDPRVDQLQSKLAGQEKELASTRDQLERATQDLDGRISSARDEFSGSIARTNEELAELKRRGERNYYEFDLFKNKEFTRIGPIGLSLRKADTRRRSYQVKLRVDDQEIEKKNVNLYEPLLISTPDVQQPVQLVVNEITKDRIKGYISEPKVRQPALARSGQGAPALMTRP